MNMADYMSRHATEWERLPKTWKEETKELEKTVWMLNLSPYTEAISFQKIIEETEKDKRLHQLKRYLQKGYMPKNMPKEWKPYKNVMDSMTISDVGLVLKGDRIVLPESLWKDAVEKAHQGGHPGETRMKS